MDFARAFENRPFNLATLTNFSALSSKTQKHLAEVYKALGWALAMATVGVFAEYKLQLNPMLLLLLTIGSLVYFSFLPYEPYNSDQQKKRFLAFSAVGFFKGCTISPLVYLAFSVNPSIVATALFSCVTIFACFSIAALNAKRRSMFYLAGILSSAMSTMCLLSLVNIFIRSPWMYLIHLYGGLLMFMGYVMYDTQMIVEKSLTMAHPDALRHALELFIDFVALFVRILVILLNKENDKKKKERK